MGTTVTIQTKPGITHPASVAVTDAGSPDAGTVVVLHHENATQSELIKAAEDFTAYVVASLAKV